MSLNLPAGMEINAPIKPAYETILTTDALALVAKLHRAFEGVRQELLQARIDRQAAIDAGEMPDFLPETRNIREGDWKRRPAAQGPRTPPQRNHRPGRSQDDHQRLQLGRRLYMTDFEDSNSPKWDNQIQGQVNLYKAIRRELSFKNEAGKEYRLNDKIATLQIRPRGWHLDEKHVTGRWPARFRRHLRFRAGLLPQRQGADRPRRRPLLLSAEDGKPPRSPPVERHLRHGAGPHRPARGTIKATVLVETILATFEMEEILYELREHSAGLNAGRWDYIFSCIKKFKKNKDFCLAQRGAITMEVPFMRSYALALVKACHKRGAPAMGGMSALIPIKNDPVANEKALAGIRHDKTRDANDGFDGGWVAHPAWCRSPPKSFRRCSATAPTSGKSSATNFGPKDWLNFQPEQPITEAACATTSTSASTTSAAGSPATAACRSTT
jgi:malate synthase